MRYLLDTDICIFVIRKKPRQVLDRLRQQLVGDVAISTVTLAELRYGADKSKDPRKNHAALAVFLAPLNIVPFDAAAADLYGPTRSDLEKRGIPIGPLDTLIAAHALSLAATLVTNNRGEFSRVSGLAIEDWTQP